MAKKGRKRSQPRSPARSRARARTASRKTARAKARTTRAAPPRSARAAPRARQASRAVRRPARSHPSRRTIGQAAVERADAPRALNFDADERSARIGEAVPVQRQRAEFPRRRVREAGLTAGETAHPERNTADDAAPDTLLDDEGGMMPADQRGQRSADTALSVVDGSAIGAGGGRDEAEDAEREPISRAEHARLQRRVARAGGSITNVEPYESLAAGSPGRDRNRGRRS